MRTSLAAVMFAGLMLVAIDSSADPIAVGDLITFEGSTGTLGGGGFLVDNTSNGTGVDFTTFCLQMSQHIDYSQLFRVGGISLFADDDAGNDPLSTSTEWIFSRYRAGMLTGYTPDEIQAAIWKLEDEWTINVGQSAALISLAESDVAGGWINDGVGVLNLFYTDGRKAQDQLTFTKVSFLPPPPTGTPEPATLAFVGVGGVALAAGKRRRRSAA